MDRDESAPINGDPSDAVSRATDSPASVAAMNPHLFVGSYTNRSSIGIHVYSVPPDDHDPELRHRSDLVEHPSFLAPSRDGRTLYAVSESDEGAVVALRIDASDGSLTEIDRVPSHGAAPCHVSVDAGGRLYVANYATGTVAAYDTEGDGRVGELIAVHRHRGTGPHPRQDGPHAHSVTVDPATGRAYAADLGTDRVVTYELSTPSATPSATDRWVASGETVLRAGTGPRHLAFHPELPVVFVVGELDSTLVSLRVDRSTGALEPQHVATTLPDDFEGASTAADVHVHPDGRRVYVSNRGHDSIATFDVGAVDEPLVPLGHVPTGGRTPRSFAIHPTRGSLVVANQDSDSIVELPVDPATGCPRPGRRIAQVPEPVCVRFVELVG